MSIDTPTACTLSAAGSSTRLAGFEALFATASCEMVSVGAGDVRARLAGPAVAAARVGEPAALEARRATIDVRMSMQYVDVLASLAEQARIVSTGWTQ